MDMLSSMPSSSAFRFRLLILELGV
jgi:hypothetical protein